MQQVTENTNTATAPAPSVIKIGRRWYAQSFPYSLKDRLKAMGCSWDPERRAWWTGKPITAQALEDMLAAELAQLRASMREPVPAPPETCTWAKVGAAWLVTGPREKLAEGEVVVHRRAKPPHKVKVGGLFEQGGRWFAHPVEDTTARGGGRRTGCSCGSREDSFGDLVPSPRNCASCRHDA